MVNILKKWVESDKVITELMFFGGVTCQKEKKDSKCISQGKIGL